MSDRQVDEFNKKIKELQDEAKETETILRELAGLEKYISETYISRVFYEIIVKTFFPAFCFILSNCRCFYKRLVYRLERRWCIQQSCRTL